MPGKSLKVGALDDPIWDDPPEVARPKDRRLRRPRWSILIVGALSVLLAVGLTLWLSRSRPGGDPGGRILKELTPASAAVPVGSTHLATQRDDSVWQPKCPDNPGGQSGWSAVRVNTTFTTALSKQQVVAAVSTDLEHDGWTRHDESFGPGQGTNAHWTKRLASGTLGEVAVYPQPPGSTNWLLTVTAKPPGFASPGC